MRHVADAVRQTPVGEHRVVARGREADVERLHVAVEEPARVRVGEGGEELREEALRLGGRQAREREPLHVHDEVGAIDALHHDVCRVDHVNAVEQPHDVVVAAERLLLFFLFRLLLWWW